MQGNDNMNQDQKNKDIFICNLCHKVPDMRIDQEYNVSLECDHNVKESDNIEKIKNFDGNFEEECLGEEFGCKNKAQCYCRNCHVPLCSDCKKSHDIKYSQSHESIPLKLLYISECQNESCYSKEPNQKIENKYYCCECKKHFCGHPKCIKQHDYHEIIELSTFYNLNESRADEFQNRLRL